MSSVITVFYKILIVTLALLSMGTRSASADEQTRPPGGRVCPDGKPAYFGVCPDDKDTPPVTIPGTPSKGCSYCPEMVRIPSLGISIGKYEVTMGQWREFVAATGYSGTNNCGEVHTGGYIWSFTWKSPGFGQSENDPVVCVSFADATAYAEWISSKTGKIYHLPNEDEWSKACQAGASHEYCGSDNVDAVAWYLDNAGGQTHPVGQKPANAYGLYDMSGNVSEWTSSCYNGACDSRVHLGGSYNHHQENMSPRMRDSGSPESGETNRGFRLAVD